MNILVIQGPNLNLIGVKSAAVGERVTIDKINKALRRHVRNRDIDLKILQTHRIDRALTLLHRNRNRADGILLAPMAWSRYEYSLKETLSLINIPVVEIYFDTPFSFGSSADDSIFSEVCIQTVTDHPLRGFITGLDCLLQYLKEHRTN
ncbi:MAG: type II 3-dehydroquinate dehydratase [FCB group bacterium]|nr:type II 3-dehydroquinate dehydratase [FCB group bacterium]